MVGSTSATRLDARQRALYHQVHPVKLATDIATAVVSLFLLAARHPWSALAVMFGPSILVSALLIRFGDSSKTHASQVGAYLRSYMTPAMQGIRLLGMGIAAMGAWLHAWWLVPLGTAFIAWGWTGGWLRSRFRRSE